MKLRPLHDRVVVKRREETRTSPGGIVLPDSAAGKLFRGEVLEVGSGKVLDSGAIRELTVKVGDNVLFARYSGTEIEYKLDGEELVVIREEDIVAVVED